MPEPRQLAPEADLGMVLDLAAQHLAHGHLIDPEELLKAVLGIDGLQLLDWLTARLLEREKTGSAAPSPYEPDATLTITYTRDADGMGPHNVQVSEVTSGPPDQSPAVSRARAREGTWRLAEAGTLAHLLELGRPLCGATDPGPWRAVSGALRCAACVDLSEVLARHG